MIESQEKIKFRAVICVGTYNKGHCFCGTQCLPVTFVDTTHKPPWKKVSHEQEKYTCKASDKVQLS
jgi:hypothetical protein